MLVKHEVEIKIHDENSFGDLKDVLNSIPDNAVAGIDIETEWVGYGRDESMEPTGIKVWWETVE